MSKITLEKHKHQLLPLEKISLDQGEMLLGCNSLAISPVSDIDIIKFLKHFAFHSFEHDHYYMRIKERDFYQLIEELELLSTFNKSLRWELIVNREGLGHLYLKKRKHQVFIEIELTGSDENTSLAIVDPTPSFDDI